jgi:hypothetical protein
VNNGRYRVGPMIVDIPRIIFGDWATSIDIDFYQTNHFQYFACGGWSEQYKSSASIGTYETGFGHRFLANPCRKISFGFPITTVTMYWSMFYIRSRVLVLYVVQAMGLAKIDTTNHKISECQCGE